MSPMTIQLGMAAVALVALAGVLELARGSSDRAGLALRAGGEGVGPVRGRLRDGADRRLRRSRAGRRLARQLAMAGVERGPAEFLALVVVVATVTLVVASAILPRLLALVAVVVAVRACWSWLRRRQGQRGEVFIGQLPEVARVLSNSASAGLAIRSAIELAAREVADPARTELALTAESLRLGQSLDQALHELEERLPSREVAVLVTTLVIQQRSGGGLATALRSMAETLDARKDLRREVRTIMAGPVMIGYLVPVLGVGTLLLLNQISPGLLDELASAGAGRVALLVSGGLYAIGLLLIRRLTKFET